MTSIERGGGEVTSDQSMHPQDRGRSPVTTPRPWLNPLSGQNFKSKWIKIKGYVSISEKIPKIAPFWLGQNNTLKTSFS